MRIQKKYYLPNSDPFKRKALSYGSSFSYCCYLNGNNIPYEYESFPEIIAIGNKKTIEVPASNFSSVFDDIYNLKDWCFGFLSYSFEELSIKKDTSFPNGIFFVPEIIITFLKNHIVSVESDSDPDTVIASINNYKIPDSLKTKINFSSIIRKDEYLKTIKELIQNIQTDNIYQVNYCVRFEGKVCEIDVVPLYNKLNYHSPMPFSGFLKAEKHFIISASPERYLKKINSKLISQPMNGTAPRNSNLELDYKSGKNLLASEKERAENIMIVDLVKKDLSTICEAGTVKVESLCSLYSFKTIHQLISTVTGKLASVTIGETVKNTFPIGSKTGAPKIKAVELLDKHETHARGPFSGTLGYFDPYGNFDFNVLIGSLFLNLNEQKAFYFAESGITLHSDPESEYEECLLKASILTNIFMD